jgi:hypothetical protein
MDELDWGHGAILSNLAGIWMGKIENVDLAWLRIEFFKR